MALLFSYGTLQQANVQLATFGRLLTGRPDEMASYTLRELPIGDPEVVRTSGKTHHPIAVFTGLAQDAIPGTAFELTDEELGHADAYEVSDYRRVNVVLRSGREAWVYVAA